jgi:hypothetical protein
VRESHLERKREYKREWRERVCVCVKEIYIKKNKKVCVCVCVKERVCIRQCVGERKRDIEMQRDIYIYS